MRSPNKSALLALAIGLLSTTCGGDQAPGVTVTQGPGDRTGYGTDTTVVVNDDGTYVVTGKPGATCIQIGADCVDLTNATGHYCGLEGAQADVIVVNGQVVDVICYPPEGSGTPIDQVAEGSGGSVDIPQPANGAVVVFDDATNDQPIPGDLTIDAERTALFGNGIDVTILGGNLDLLSNNSRVRSLTVDGDVHYHENSNNSAISFCKVHGDLVVDSNGFVGLETQVFGSVHVTGNGATLVDIGVGGQWDVNSSAFCSGCYSIDDQNGDFVVQEPDEHGDAVACGPGPG